MRFQPLQEQFRVKLLSGEHLHSTTKLGVLCKGLALIENLEAFNSKILGMLYSEIRQASNRNRSEQ